MGLKSIRIFFLQIHEPIKSALYYYCLLTKNPIGVKGEGCVMYIIFLGQGI